MFGRFPWIRRPLHGLIEVCTTQQRCPARRGGVAAHRGGAHAHAAAVRDADSLQVHALPGHNVSPPPPPFSCASSPPRLSLHCQTSTRLNRKLRIAANTARPQPQAADRSGHYGTSTTSSRSQWALPHVNRKGRMAVGTIYWTSTASARSQWALPDFNRKRQNAVGTTGLQPQAPGRRDFRRTPEVRIANTSFLWNSPGITNTTTNTTKRTLPQTRNQKHTITPA